MPKLSTSARESSWTPNSDVVLVARATRPSRPSKMPASTSSAAAQVKCQRGLSPAALRLITTLENPQRIEMRVIAEGRANLDRCTALRRRSLRSSGVRRFRGADMAPS